MKTTKKKQSSSATEALDVTRFGLRARGRYAVVGALVVASLLGLVWLLVHEGKTSVSSTGDNSPVMNGSVSTTGDNSPAIGTANGAVSINYASGADK